MEAVILSSWDYIMGPQLEKLWLITHAEKDHILKIPVDVIKNFNLSKTCVPSFIFQNYDFKEYSSMAGQLLLGEIDNFDIAEKCMLRTYTSNSKVLVSLLFSMKSWIHVGTVKEVTNIVFCVGFIFRKDALKFILQRQAILNSALRKIVNVFVKLKIPLDFSELEDTIEDVTLLIKALYCNYFICIQAYSPLFISLLTSNVLHEAVISHLQTSGHTAVVGLSDFKINQVIHILSLFNNEKELNCSRLMTHSSLKSSNLFYYIHGVFKNTEKDYEYLLLSAFNDSSCLTVIDTDLGKVWQTWPYHRNFDKNRTFFTVTERGYFIPQLLKDITFVEESQKHNQIVIKNFTKFLLLKATAMIKVVCHLRSTKNISRYDLMQLFGIQTVTDCEIVLGFAEKLKPGFRSFIL